MGGVYVIWHAGVHPQWVFVGRSDNLAADFDAVADNDEIMAYEVNGGLYVSWSLLRPDHRDGVVAYLIQALAPIVPNPDRPAAGVTPIPVLTPGRKLATT